MPEQLTDEERMVLKTAAFGAVFLVSNADPGPLSMIKESFAASNAIAGTTGVIREALITGGPPALPSGSPAEVESTVLSAMRRALEILRVKAPSEMANYREVVLDAVERVARAARGVVPSEVETITKIREALTAAD